jgi:hypothetical protein
LSHYLRRVAGLVPAGHVFRDTAGRTDADARDQRGQDDNQLVSNHGYEGVNPSGDEPMKQHGNTAQPDDAAQASSSGTASHPVDAARASEIAGEIPIIAAPGLADAAAPAAAESPRPQTPPEAARIEAQPHARKEPVLPRAAILGPPPSSAPRVEAQAPAPNAGTPAAAANERRPRRFALLTVCVALSAGLGALGGSLAVDAIGRLLAPPPPAPAAHADASEEIRALKDSVAQLRPNLKAIGDNVAAVRAGLNASFSSSTAQFAKIAEAIEKLERHQAERHVAAAPPPASEATGSIAPAPASASKPASPGVVEGWVLRKAYRGAALVEGRYGIIEIEPGDHLPGVGRVEEIKRQDGHWVVVTARGLIVGVQ